MTMIVVVMKNLSPLPLVTLQEVRLKQNSIDTWSELEMTSYTIMPFSVLGYFITVMVIIVDTSYSPLPSHRFARYNCRHVWEDLVHRRSRIGMPAGGAPNEGNMRSNFQVCAPGMKCIEGLCLRTIYADIPCRAALFGAVNLQRPELFPVTAFQIDHNQYRETDELLCVYCVDNLEPKNTAMLPCGQFDWSSNAIN
ncbi:uncharacterized protein LOC111260282 [Varroa jacobsoni]|uniref:uncharacterized protein LOC111260282 n=1 Tax=Varroa jacobsoni TaxID=62625 RepID=UPI000BF7B813|nr:uncharacterized protein LOC111260282 [Varroa jacobsoni]